MPRAGRYCFLPAHASPPVLPSVRYGVGGLDTADKGKGEWWGGGEARRQRQRGFFRAFSFLSGNAFDIFRCRFSVEAPPKCCPRTNVCVIFIAAKGHASSRLHVMASVAGNANVRCWKTRCSNQRHVFVFDLFLILLQCGLCKVRKRANVTW